MDNESTAPKVLRDPTTGRLLPGTAAVPNAGRKTKAREDAYLSAIKNALSPEQLTEALQKALDIAIELKSPRSIIAVCGMVAEYGLGKPTQTIATKQIGDKAEWLMDFITSSDTAPLLPGDDELLPATSGKPQLKQ